MQRWNICLQWRVSKYAAGLISIPQWMHRIVFENVTTYIFRPWQRLQRVIQMFKCSELIVIHTYTDVYVWESSRNWLCAELGSGRCTDTLDSRICKSTKSVDWWRGYVCCLYSVLHNLGKLRVLAWNSEVCLLTDRCHSVMVGPLSHWFALVCTGLYWFYILTEENMSAAEFLSYTFIGFWFSTMLYWLYWLYTVLYILWLLEILLYK